MIIFKKVRLKNFRSFGNQWNEVELDRNPLTLISAPNGSGKSTILMAIEWCLFGKVGSLTKKEIVNVVNGGDCAVELEIENDVKKLKIKVCRGIEPNFLNIYENGKLVPQNASVRDYGQVVEQLTGLNRNVFNRIVSINGSSYIPFLSLNTTARREMVENILEITELKALNWKNNEHLNALENEINLYKGKVEGLEHTIRKLKEEKKESNDANKEKTKELLGKMQETLGGRSLADVEGEFRKMLLSKNTLTNKQKTLQSVGDFWRNDKCPTCGQPIAETLKNEKLAENEKQKKQVEETLSVADDVIAKAEETLKRARVLEKEIGELLAVSKQKSSEHTIEELVVTCEKITAKLGELKETVRYHNAIKKWLKDDGIRSIIISKYLPLFNKTLKKYLTDIGLDVSIELNKVFEAKITRRNGEERSYASFSAGERARIDVCFLLSWKSLISSNKFVDTSLLFMDEIYDSVLDAEGLDNLIGMLYNMHHTNVFFISHREGIGELFQHKLEIVKDRGFSRIL